MHTSLHCTKLHCVMHIMKVIEICYCCWVTQSCSTLCDPMDCTNQASLSFTISWNFLKRKSIEFTDRLPCLSPSSGACSNSWPSSRWYHPTISSSVVPFSSCLQSFPPSGSFPLSQIFALGGQSIGSSASVGSNIEDWPPLGWTGWISLQAKGLSRVFSNTTVQKHQFFHVQLSSWSNSHIHTWLLEKPSLWLCGPFLVKWCPCFLICCLGLL